MRKTILLFIAGMTCLFSITWADAPHEMTAEDVGAYLDGMLPQQLEREDIAGAVIVVVKDGKVLFARGYGYADVAKRISVSAETTLFRPGSISKLFTWTSIMQLVEQKKLDLDRDVNSYLDFKIPETYSKPITLRNIMTHTAGFEETAKDVFTDKPENTIALGDYLKHHIPDRIFPPGTVPAYSNYATSLAGYIVARVSGKPFEEYVADFIFKPLGMSHSTFQQPLPGNMRSSMSCGYESGSDDPKPFEIVIPFPAGSLSSSGADMARFMIAHLLDGQYEGKQVLNVDTARQMHARQILWADDLPGMALGFYEENRNGLRIIGHAGDTIYFHSDLHLIPGKGVGLFIAYNSAGRSEVRGRRVVWEKFLDRYFPYTVPGVKAVPDTAQHIKEVTGRYLTSRRPEGDILHIAGRLEEMSVTPGKDNTIEIDAFKNANGKLKRWQEIKPMVFRELDGQDMVAFKRIEGTSRLRMITSFPVFVFDRVSWYDNVNFTTALIIFSLSIFFLTLILWPVAFWIRRHYGKRLNLSPSERRLRMYVRLACAVNLIFPILFGSLLLQADGDLSILNTKMDIWFRLIQIIGVIGLAAAVIPIYAAYRFFSSENSNWFKFQYALIALAAVSFVWFVLQNHLLDFSLRY